MRLYFFVMILVIGFFIFGILSGFLFRNKTGFISFSDRASVLFVYVLLFFLGFSVGVNEKIVNNLGTIGLKALIISLASLGGSLILSKMVYIQFFREKN